MSMSITQQIALARINFKKEEKQMKTLSNNLTGLAKTKFEEMVGGAKTT